MRKKMKMTTAATRAPTSGRASKRLERPRVTRLDGSAGADGGVVWVVWLIGCSKDWGQRGGRPAVPGHPGRRCGLTGVLLDERHDGVDVALVDEGRTGEDGPSTAHDVAVLQVQVELADRQVALQVRLLVDGELKLAVLHRLSRIDVQVERADLGRAARRGDRLDRVQRLSRTQRDDIVDGLVLAELGLNGRGDCGVVGAVDLNVLGAREAVLDALAPILQGDRSGLLDHAQRLLAAGGLDLLTRLLAGQELVRGEVGERSGLLVEVEARVEAVDGNAGRNGLLDVRDERVRGDKRGGDAVDLRVDRILDEDGLLGRVRICGVLQGGPGVLGRLLSPRLDPVPEGVPRGLVGDHGEGVARVPATASAAGVVVALRGSSPTARRRDERQCRYESEGATLAGSARVHREVPFVADSRLSDVDRERPWAVAGPSATWSDDGAYWRSCAASPWGPW